MKFEILYNLVLFFVWAIILIALGGKWQFVPVWAVCWCIGWAIVKIIKRK